MQLTFSLDACRQSIRDILFNRKSHQLAKGITDETTEKQFYGNVEAFVKSDMFYKNYTASQERMEDFKRIVQLCKVKNIELKVCITPIHASQLEGIVAAGSWQAYEDWKRQIVLLVPVIDFTAYNNFTTENFSQDRKFFADSSHMKIIVANNVLDRLAGREPSLSADFGVLINPDNIDAHLQNIRSQRDEWRASNPELVEKIAFFKGFLAQKPRVLMGKAEIGGEMVVRVDHLLGQSYSTKQAVLKKDAPLTIGGWGFAKGQVGKEAFLALKATDGREYYAVLDKVKRQDVANMLQNQDFVDSGFSGSSFCDDVPVGKYELRLIVLNEDQQVYSAILGEIDLCE